MAFFKSGSSRSTAPRAARSQAAITKAVAESLERRTLLSLSFAPQVTYPVSAAPNAIVAADFNGDGKLDLATVNSDGNVNILLGKGNGTFHAAKSIADGMEPTTGKNVHLAVGDFNGHADLVVTDYTEQVIVLLGNGDGTFQTPHIYSLTSNVASIAVADLTGDGHGDLVLGDGNGDVTVLLGNGGGTFQSPKSFQVASCPIGSIAVGDFTTDGKPDVVTGSLNGAVDLLLGNGDGTFGAPRQIYSTGTSQFGFAALDATGNGDEDIVLGKDAGVLVTLLGNGNGTFKTSAPSAMIGNLDGGTGADVNGDGIPDAVLADGTTGQVEIALGNGDGTFKAPVLYSVGNVPASLVVADLTGNGKNDIVTANYGSSTISVLINQTADLKFVTAPTISIPNAPRSVTAADLTGNGLNDLIVTDETNSTIEVFMGNGDGTFKPAEIYSVSNDPTAAVVGDLGNGHQDIVVASPYGTVSVFLGNGDGTFKSPIVTTVGYTISPGTQSIALADVNGDTRDDLIVANGGNGSFSVLLGNGDGTFKAATTFNLYGTGVTSSGNAEAIALAVGDFNGHPDVAVTDTAYGHNFVDVFLGNGNGTFASPAHYSTGNYPSSIAIGDVNGDKNSDIVVGNKYSASVTVLLGNGNGIFAAPVSFTAHNYPQAVAIADVNGDGNPDIITVNTSTTGYGAGHVNILPGNGNGTFAPPHAYSVGNYARSLAVADLTGDGKPDIVTGNGSSYSLSILLNNNPGIVTMPGGVVDATGTNANTSATVSYSGGDVTLSLDGQTETFDQNMVNAIDINLGEGHDTVMVASGVGSVSINGGAGEDMLMADNAAPDTLSGGRGADTLMGGGKGSSLMGNVGNDIIVPFNHHETVSGGGGNDTLSGAGHDSLAGGGGTDIFLDAGAKKDTIDGGTGLSFAQNNPTDSMSNIYEVFDPPAPVAASVSAAGPAIVSDVLAPGPLDSTDAVTASVVNGELKVIGMTGANTISVALNGAGTKVKVVGNGAKVGKFTLAGLSGIHVNGGSGNNASSVAANISLPATLRGHSGDDTLVGGGGDNVLIGGGGDDSLVGGAGTNLLIPDRPNAFVGAPAGNVTLDGGTGFSIADFSRRTDPLTLSNDGKPDSGDSAAGEKSEIMSNVSAIWGSTGGDTIVGTTPGEFLSGGAGANSVHGGGANDLLVGGGGNDTVIVAAEPVSLYLVNGHPNEYGGVFNPAEDILQLQPGLDQSIQVG